MSHIDLIALLAVAQFLFFGFLVGRARRRRGVDAPATRATRYSMARAGCK